MSKKLTIAVDIDDVLSSQIEVLIAFSNERYGMSLTTRDFQKPGEYWGYYEKVWEISKEEGARRFSEFLEERYPLRQTVSAEALSILQKLKKHYRLEVVTSRSADYQEGTVHWLEQHVPDIFDDIHFVELWNKGAERVTKAYICKEIGAGYLIDDNVEHCALAVDAGIQALLFGNYGWNQTTASLPPGVTRVADWQAVKEYFDAA